jgi:hypothetical protein
MVKPRDAMNWHGPYMEKDIPLGSLGQPYVYECPGKHNPFRLRPLRDRPRWHCLCEIGTPPKNKGRTGPDGRAAFTLVELILVMTIMVMIISMVFAFLEGIFPRAQPRQRGAAVPSVDTLRAKPRHSTKASRSNCGSIQGRLLRLEALSGYTETQTKPMTFRGFTVQIAFPRPPRSWCIPITGRRPRRSSAR